MEIEKHVRGYGEMHVCMLLLSPTIPPMVDFSAKLAIPVCRQLVVFKQRSGLEPLTLLGRPKDDTTLVL